MKTATQLIIFALLFVCLGAVPNSAVAGKGDQQQVTIVGMKLSSGPAIFIPYGDEKSFSRGWVKPEKEWRWVFTHGFGTPQKRGTQVTLRSFDGDVLGVIRGCGLFWRKLCFYPS